MKFLYPYFLLLLLPFAFLIFLEAKKKWERQPELTYSSLSLFSGTPPSFRERHPNFTRYLRLAALGLLIIALARPQHGTQIEEISTQGVDIMLTLDISGSMESRDFQPNRLAVAKAVMEEFIRGRRNDRLGLVVFASKSFTQCPLTLNYEVLVGLLRQVQVGTIQEKNTAIGLALANAVARLKDSDAKSKVVVLLTDGVNNVFTIDPLTAAEVAKKMKIKVYTVGVGSTDPRLPPDMRVDEETLKQIAESTGGAAFLAQDEKALADIYREIDRLEKSEIKSKIYADYRDIYFYFLFPALALLLLEAVLKETTWRVIP